MVFLITGGAGFIGTNFIYYLLEKYKNEIKIINVDKLTYAGNLANLSALTEKENYIFIKADIIQQEKIEEIFQAYKPDYVVNFAAESHVDRSILNPHIFVQTNVLGTQVLLDVALKYGVKRFHQISTDEVYGSLGKEGYFTEKTSLSPRSPYSASKASADLLCLAYHHTYNLPITISRCSNNYGPYQFPEKLIPLMINNILQGKSLPIYGDGENIRDWLYVDDHCQAVDIILQQGQSGEVYNIGGNNEWTNIALVKVLLQKVYNALPKDDQRKKHINEKLITYVEDRKGHDRRYAIDASKMQEQFAWQPKINFQEGIEKTINWYLKNEKGDF